MERRNEMKPLEKKQHRFSIGELVYYKRDIGSIEGYYSNPDHIPRYRVKFGSGSLLVRADELRRL